MRWRWKRLLIVPLLASAHACDCGGDDSGCAINWNPDFSCGPLEVNPCGIGGQCFSEGGTCPNGLRLDRTTSCDDGGGFCCALPLPSCADLGGVCQATLNIGISDFCPQGTLDGDCGDAGVCCAAPIGDDGSSDDGSQALDAPSTDAEDAPNTPVIGSCNEAPCPSGCTCLPFSPDAGPVWLDAALSPDAGGGICVCALVDASADADGLQDVDAGDARTSDESDAEEGDAMLSTDGSAEAGAAGPCGVIVCAAECTCRSPSASACVCP